MQQILEFVKFLHKFQQIQRSLYATDENRNENDAEHSFQLALLAWYIVDSEKLNYNIDKIIRYALVHDLVETYAGDTYFFTKDKKLRDSKHEREQKALQLIKKNFSEFSDLSKWINGYETKQDAEAKFVYALDKMLPVLNIYLDNGRTWKDYKVTYKMIRTKDKKIKVNRDVLKIWKRFVKLIDAQADHLFAKG